MGTPKDKTLCYNRMVYKNRILISAEESGTGRGLSAVRRAIHPSPREKAEEENRMKKRLLAMFVSLCMAASMLPVQAFAEDEPVCSCTERCTSDAVNTDCPVCGVEGADLSACLGVDPPPEGEGESPGEDDSPQDPGAGDSNVGITITGQPEDCTAIEGKYAIFSVEATSSEGGSLWYYWYQSTDGGQTWQFLEGESYSDSRCWIMNVTPEMSGYQYRCTVKMPSNSDQKVSKAATLTVIEKTRIVQQPAACAVTEGESAAFQVAATGEGLSYQWQQSTDGQSWSDVEGATTDRYTIPVTTPEMNGTQYRCVVTGRGGTVESEPATLTVYQNTVITGQPEDLAVTEEKPATFQVEAAGEELSYQWQQSNGGSWSDVADATAASYTIPAATLDLDNTQYRCVVTGRGGTVESEPATLTVHEKTRITLQPDDLTVIEGGSATFRVEATGEELSYQWQQSPGGIYWTDIDGATSDSYTIPVVTLYVDNMQYRCVVTGLGGTVESESAILDVDVKLYVTDPQDVTVLEGVQAAFKASSDMDASYQWQQSRDGQNWTNIDGATFYIYYVNIPTPEMNGMQYRCVVSKDGYTKVSKAATLTVRQRTTIIDTSDDPGVTEGEPAVFWVEAVGENLTYQWQQSTDGENWYDVTGATGESYTILATTLDMDGMLYRCVVTGADVADTWPISLMVYKKTQITLQPDDLTVRVGEMADFQVSATGTNLTYQWQQSTDGQNWSDLMDAVTDSYTIPATTPEMNGTQYRCVVTGLGGKAESEPATLTVYQDTAITGQPKDLTVTEEASAAFQVSATGTNLTYQWQKNNGGSWSDVADATGASYTIQSAALDLNGAQYRCVVTGLGGTVESEPATLTVHEKTRITLQPGDLTVMEGQSAAFQVSATGTQLTYQWQQSTDGQSWSDVEGATTDSYTIPATTPEMNGTQYRCVVTGLGGKAESKPVTLTVNRKTVITGHPKDLAVTEEEPAAFQVSATGTNLTYQWQQNNGENWTDVADATADSYTIPATTPEMNGTRYRCVVTGLGGTVESEPATLTVYEKTRITLQPGDLTVMEGQSAAFQVSATGEEISYQWQQSADGRNWSDVVDAVAASYTIPATTPEMNGTQYRCVVTGLGGTVESEAAALMVRERPELTLSVMARDGSVDLSWEKPEGPELTGYALYVTAGSFDGSETPILIQDPEVTSYTVETLPDGTPLENSKAYAFYLVALYSFDQGDVEIPSDPVSATPNTLYLLTVEGGGDGATVSGKYAADNTITIRAGTKADSVFLGWTSDDEVAFADADSPVTTLRMPAADITITANWHTHSWSADWSSDDTHHWRNCSGCAEKGAWTEHSFVWVTDQAATATQAGFRHEECTVCGYARAKVEIPPTGTQDESGQGGSPDSSEQSTSQPSQSGSSATSDASGNGQSTQDSSAASSAAQSAGQSGSGQPSGATLPATGDDSPLELWAALLLCSGAGLCAAAVCRKKRQKHTTK